jgi:L-threonylcarbamoyladenylate synthase
MKTISAHRSGEYAAAAASAVEYLQDGGVVIIPTDTAYCLAADATNEDAVNQIFSLKGRHDGRPLSVIAADREQAQEIGEFSPIAVRLWEEFMPGPLTIVVPDKGVVSSRVTAGLGKIGIRMPGHPLPVLVAERFGRPFTATSANRSGEPPAFSPDEFLQYVEEDFLPHATLDAGQLPITPVSTVVEVTDSVTVLREGPISEAQIKAVIG